MITYHRQKGVTRKGMPMISTSDAAGSPIARLAASKRLQGAAIGLAAGSLLTTGVAVASAGAPAVAPEAPRLGRVT